MSDISYVSSLWETFRPDRTYSDIVLTDGLEHVEDPLPILLLIKEWLGFGGRCHIIVPNALSLHRLIGVEMGIIPDVHALNDHDCRAGHKRVFDVYSLQAMISESGMHLIALEGIQLKPLADAQLAEMSEAYFRALNGISHHFPAHGAEIYACVGHMSNQ